ncbi:MAG: hypothetical protein KGJ90_05120 [Patescibacteria group bacterium]|nr:hypothetical protein [Patescibacteria group bacterium]
MTITLSTLRNRIGARLQDASFQSVSVSNINDVINQSLRHYKYFRFWFNDNESDITLPQGTPGQPSVVPNIPSDFLQELPQGGLSILYANIYFPLEKRSSMVFDSENVGAIGLPYMYVYRAQQFEVYYLPNIAYTLKFRYIKDYADLVNDTDTNDFLTFADKLIYYDSLMRIFGEFKQDEKMESYYGQKAADEFETVTRRTSSLVATGTLVLNSNLLS